ncbi:hypothetical protein WUBG_01064, partial [Wuchereria bancrofti]
MGGGRRRRIERSSSSIDRRYKRPRNSSERHRRNESRNRRARRRSWNKKNSDHFYAVKGIFHYPRLHSTLIFGMHLERCENYFCILNGNK